MKTRLLILGTMLLAGSAAAQPVPGTVGHPETQLVSNDPSKAAAGLYQIDPTHTSVLGRVLHGKLSFYTFRFDKFDGFYTYDPAKPEASKVDVTIDPSTIDTYQPPSFDARLKGPDFLDAAKYPAIHFVSTAIKRRDMTHGTMTGNLTLHGVTRPFTFDVTFNGGGPAGRRLAMGFSATGALEMKDYGIDIGANNIADGVSIVVEAEFINQNQQTDVKAVQQLQAPKP